MRQICEQGFRGEFAQRFQSPDSLIWKGRRKKHLLEEGHKLTNYVHFPIIKLTRKLNILRETRRGGNNFRNLSLFMNRKAKQPRKGQGQTMFPPQKILSKPNRRIIAHREANMEHKGRK